MFFNFLLGFEDYIMVEIVGIIENKYIYGYLS